MRLARGFQTRCDFISLNAWERVIQNPQYAVDATAGVYSFVNAWHFHFFSNNSIQMPKEVLHLGNQIQYHL